MMWNNLVHPSARASQRVYWKQCEVQMPISYPSKVANHPRSDFFNNYFLLQLIGNVYNLHIDLDLRRASSRQHCNH